MIVLDASVLIALLDTADPHHDRAFDLVMKHADRPFAASAMTLAEVLVGPTRSGTAARTRSALRRLEVTPVPIDTDAPARLAGLRAETGLKLPDCCVVDAAEQVDGGVATFDRRLAGVADGRGISVLGG